MKAGVVLVLPPSVEEVDVVECCASDVYGDMAGRWPGDLRDVEVCIGLGGNREWGLREKITGRERGRTLMNSLITMAFIVLGVKLMFTFPVQLPRALPGPGDRSLCGESLLVTDDVSDLLFKIANPGGHFNQASSLAA